VRESVSFVKGDMRDWPGSGDAFDAVVIACCSASHLLTLDDRRRTWATAFRLLRPGGVFVLDVRVPDLATLAESQRLRPRAFVDLDIDATRIGLGDEARLLRCTATTYKPHLQRADVRLIYDRFDQSALAERLVADFASHVYFPAEVELLFVSAGFEIAQQYGDYRFVPRGPDIRICGYGSAPVTPFSASPVSLRAFTSQPITLSGQWPVEPRPGFGTDGARGRGSHDTRQHRHRIDQS